MTDAELLEAGWEPCFMADEPRLSEAVETYREIGFEVLLQPVRLDGEACSECMKCEPERFRMIYVRRPRTPMNVPPPDVESRAPDGEPLAPARGE